MKQAPVNPDQRVNPEMLTVGRESRGVTQADLARKLDVTQGKVSKLERGLLTTTSAEITAISSALGYPVAFFYQNETMYGVGTSEVFHRKRQAVPNRLLSKIHAQINVRRMHIKHLLQAVEIEFQIPTLDVDDYGGCPEDVARAVRSMWLLPAGPVENLSKVVENAGGIIVPFDFGTRQIDAISRCVPGLPPLFFVNPRIPGDRLRFTICHELGHVVMHSTPHPQMEREADKFAAEFLMPEAEIGPSLTDLGLEKLAALKPFWKVSMAALLQRASALGRIGEPRARQLWMRMAAEGFRTREPAELDIPMEEPSLLGEIISVHQAELNYSVAELSHLVRLNEPEFCSTYLSGGPVLRVVG